MNIKKIIACALVISALMPLHRTHAETSTALAACVLEQETGACLQSKNAHMRLANASTTKVLTALIAIEQGDLCELVRTDSSAYGVEGSSIYLEKNEQISLKDLLYGLMLRSGNDAAVAIACHIGGSVNGFCDMMNARAARIGAQNTHFRTPHGLPDNEHFTTAYDLALICREAMNNDTFKKIVATEYYRTESGAKPRTMMNKNKLLQQYSGATGIKTGYTDSAGKCLTFSADRDNMSVVGVVLNCPDMWNEAKKLMDYAFLNYSRIPVMKANTHIMRTQIKGSDGTLLSICTASELKVVINNGSSVKLKPQIRLQRGLTAPIPAGKTVGTLELYENSRCVASCDLIAANSVLPASFGYYLRRVLRMWN